MLEIYIIDQVYLQLDMKTACTRRNTWQANPNAKFW